MKVLYLYELKKVLCQKVLWVAAALMTLLLVGVGITDVITGNSANSKGYKEFSGRAIDDSLIRETQERAENALNISLNANEGYLLFQTRNERLIYLSIREPSVLTAFYDYLESMKPEKLCTEEEMLERVEAILHEFVACHSDTGSI